MQPDKVELILRTVLKLHNKMLSQDSYNQEDIKNMILSMQQEILSNFGAGQKQEVTVILQKLVDMTDFIQSTFLQFKKMFKEHKDELIREISKERPRTSITKES